MRDKIYLALLVILLLAAQGTEAQRMNSRWVDASFGINSTWIVNQNAYGNSEMDYSTTFGLTGGVGFSHFATENWGYKCTFLLSSLGQRYSGSQETGDAKRKLKLTYVQVPLLVIRKMAMADYPTWIAFGPDFCFLVDAKQEFESNEGYRLRNPETMVSGNVKDRFNQFDLALNFSVNKIYPLKYTDNLMLLFSIDSAFGLLDMNAKDWQILNYSKVYKSSHSFYIGIKTGLVIKLSRR